MIFTLPGLIHLQHPAHWLPLPHDPPTYTRTISTGDRQIVLEEKDHASYDDRHNMPYMQAVDSTTY
ncbi:hypothetical protein PAMP_011424 [Pampus punctatissimus]